MRKLFAFSLALLVAGCTSSEQPPSVTSEPSNVQPTAQRDCLRIVKGEMGNIANETTPIFQRALKSCNRGLSHYSDSYVSCVQQSPYSNALDCMRKARGIHKPQNDPPLEDAREGEDGQYSATANEMLAVLYKGTDPKQSIDSITIKMYLKRRDKAREAARLPKIEDGHSATGMTHSSFEQGGDTYWIVRQTYQDLQIAKIMRDARRGSESVICAQYGSDRKLELDNGLCAGLLMKYFKIAAPGA